MADVGSSGRAMERAAKQAQPSQAAQGGASHLPQPGAVWWCTFIVMIFTVERSGSAPHSTALSILSVVLHFVLSITKSLQCFNIALVQTIIKLGDQ